MNSNTIESNVRTYCRTFDFDIAKSKDSYIFDINNEKYIDFLMGCGSLNYGHNNDYLQLKLVDYIQNNGITMSMDLNTQAKNEFLNAFYQIILNPRSLDYKVQFTGPTGANAIEAAIKLARKIKKRSTIISFTNGFHGCSLGALSLTGNKFHRHSSQKLLTDVVRLPYDNYNDKNHANLFEYFKFAINDPSSGIEAPAAIVLETIQGEGGLNVASNEWLRNVRKFANEIDALLIIDDIQAGCGRSGDFFSFEFSDIIPDMVTMAKAISGFGLPMALLLIKPEYDIWHPGEHNGTFRGNNLAFVTAKHALEKYWSDDNFLFLLKKNCKKLKQETNRVAQRYDLQAKGRGMMMGIKFNSASDAQKIQKYCFIHNLILERCGPYDEIIKFLPSLLISEKDMDCAFSIIDNAILTLVKGRNNE